MDYSNIKHIAKKSKKQVESDKILHNIYEKMAREQEHVCFFCGSPNQLTHLHLIRRSWNKELAIHPLNIVYGCMECHITWDDKPYERVNLPNYNKAMQIGRAHV